MWNIRQSMDLVNRYYHGPADTYFGDLVMVRINGVWCGVLVGRMDEF